MPAAFDKCVREGGKVKTTKISNDKYAHICIDKQGKTHLGEIKTKIKEKK